jgi:hypothetical protein
MNKKFKKIKIKIKFRFISFRISKLENKKLRKLKGLLIKIN